MIPDWIKICIGFSVASFVIGFTMGCVISYITVINTIKRADRK